MLLSMVQKTIAMSEGSRVHVKVPSCHLSCKSSQRHPSALQTIDCTLADYQLQKSVGQTTNRNRARLPSLFGIIFTQVSSQYSNRIWEVQGKWGCVWRRLPATNPAKAALPFSSSNNQLHSCRLSIAEKHRANNQKEQSKAPLTVWYEIHTSAQPIQKLICRTNNIAQQFSCLFSW
jgi:hypothetical protein